MKSYTITALSIAFKTWIIALLINTIAVTLLLGGFSEGSSEALLLIGLFGGIFSAPIFLVIWAIVYGLLKSGKTAGYILIWLLIAGVSMAIAAWGVFTNSFRYMDNELIRLIIVAPVSGAIGISISYPGIKKACLARDEEKMLLQNFDAEQTAGI